MMANDKLDVVSDAVACAESAKIKTHFAKIIVGGTARKPYYDILYFDPKDRTYHIGFGSFCLEFVFKWLSEEFEIVDAPTVDPVEVVRCRDCVYWGDEDGFAYSSDGIKFGRCVVNNYLIGGRHIGWCPAENDFCSGGERRAND